MHVFNEESFMFYLMLYVTYNLHQTNKYPQPMQSRFKRHPKTFRSLVTWFEKFSFVTFASMKNFM